MILLIDTSTPVCYLTVVKDLERTEREWEAGRGLAKGLLSFIRDSLGELNATFEDIKAIGVFAGPGSYTGLRIGITVANTLADGLSVPIVAAQNPSWQDTAIQRLSSGENDIVALPHYGGEAIITSPRK